MDSAEGIDLVIDVGNVHHKCNIKLEKVSQYPSQDVGADIVSRMAQMSVVVDCRSAGIPGNALAIRIEGHEGDF